MVLAPTRHGPVGLAAGPQGSRGDQGEIGQEGGSSLSPDGSPCGPGCVGRLPVENSTRTTVHGGGTGKGGVRVVRNPMLS
jgi:hypothetical protein